MNATQFGNLASLVVAGLQFVGGEAASGADKKQVAMDTLQESAGIATQIDPKDKSYITASTALADVAIETAVAAFKHGGWFHKKAVAAPSPTAVPSPTPA